MKQQLAAMWRVGVREITSRWVLLPAAIVVGTLALLAIRSIDHVRGDADGMLNTTWLATLVVSLIVGMSLLGDELANGRLSFYFVRPFSNGAIFGGKLVAGVALALVIQGAILTFVALGLPTLAWKGSAIAERGLVAIVCERALATVACTILGMAATIVFGSKTRWFVLDVVCTAVVGLITAWVAVRATHAGSGDRDTVALVQIAGLAAAVVGLAVATARALARGRTDRARAHAALSTTLWPIVMPAAGLVLLATVAWL